MDLDIQPEITDAVVASPDRDARIGYVPGLGSQPGDVDRRGCVRVFTNSDDMGVWLTPEEVVRWL